MPPLSPPPLPDTPAKRLAPSAAGARRCRNCEAPLTSRYCPDCGQRDLPADPTLGELLAEAWDAFVSVDGKVLASLRLLLARPGALTTEYLAGHRARYLPPLRLYLACSVVYFVVSSALPSRATSGGLAKVAIQQDSSTITLAGGDTAAAARGAATARARARRDSIRAVRDDSARRAILATLGRRADGPLDSARILLADSVMLERRIARELGGERNPVKRAVLERMMRNGARIGREKKSFLIGFREQLPRVMFVLMPAFAALLALVYRSRRLRYPTHLIVSLHLHAFGFAAMTLSAVFEAMANAVVRNVGTAAVALWMVAYLPVALRRVYGGRPLPTVVRAITLAAVYSVVGGLAIAGLALALVLFY